MRNLWTMILFSVLVLSGCQNRAPVSEDTVSEAVNLLMTGITNADEAVLREITADELVYGHSNGNVQDKTAFIAEIVSKRPLVYKDIKLLNQTIRMAGEVAVVRHIFTAETLGDGKPGTLRIGNMLVWQWREGRWKLVARQAYRLK